MTNSNKTEFNSSKFVGLLSELDPDDLNEDTLFLVQDLIAAAYAKIEQGGNLEEELKELDPEEAEKLRTIVNRRAQWHNNRTIN